MFKNCGTITKGIKYVQWEYWKQKKERKELKNYLNTNNGGFSKFFNGRPQTTGPKAQRTSSRINTNKTYIQAYHI